MKIAYLGPEKSFTEIAAKSFDKNGEYMPMQPIRKVILAVENNEVDYGVVPLENFYNGEVRETLDTLTELKETKIIKDKAIKIIHCIGALRNHKNIEKIYSKDQALEQSSKYLCEKYPKIETIAVSSTSEAVDIIVKNKLLNSAAIASEESLKSKGFIILAKDICPNNKTRFVLLSKKENPSTGNDKTFLVFHPLVKDRPGTLHQYIGFFSNLNINLEYIQSRPDGKGSYYFYIELEGHYNDKNIEIALNGLKYALDPENKYPSLLKILGSYPRIDWKNDN